jgi:hypothetical protein
MRTFKVIKIEKRMSFLKDKIIYCQANGLKPNYFCNMLEIETNNRFKQRREEYKQEEQHNL